MSRLIRGLLLSVVVGGAVYAAIAAAYGDFSKVQGHLLRFPKLLLLAGLLLASANYAFRFVRWQYYLRLLDVRVPALPSLGIFLAGFSLTVTPGKVGEVLKSYLLKQAYGTPLLRTAPIVVAERLTDLIALLLLTLVGVSSWMGRGEKWLMAIGFLLCAGLVVVVATRPLAHGAINLLGRLLPARTRAGVVPKLHEFYDATALLVRPRALVYCTLLSVLSWFCECVAFLVILRGFPGVQSTLLLATFIYSMMTVAGALAFVPGGIGVTEGGMAVLLAKLCQGADESVAVAATLIIRVLTLWFAVALGVLALLLVQRMKNITVDLSALRGTQEKKT